MDERQERVHPGRQYGVFILSHGRPNKQLTYTTLRREGYTGPIRIVCDDEDSTVEDYKKNFPGEVLVFNKAETIKKTETFYNQPYHKTVMYARHTLYDFSRQLGWTHFIMMDDDYYHIYFKWNHYYKEVGLTRFKGMEAQRLDELFDATFDLLADSRASTISFAQGGDTLGGSSGKAGTHWISRKAMNSHFVDVNRPLDFRGFVNEDVNLYAEFPGNRFIFQTNRVSVDPAHTQQNGGGATDLYLAFGTYVKSFMTVICAPSCTKVMFMQFGKQQGRMHHCVKMGCASPAILSGRWKKDDGDSTIGLKENPAYSAKDAEYERQMLEVHPNPPESWKTDPIDKTCKVNSMRRPKTAKSAPKTASSKRKQPKVIEVQAPKPPDPAKPISIPSVFKVEPVSKKSDGYELIVDSLKEIDARTFGKLMMEMKKRVGSITVVHGDHDCEDVVVKLCSGLNVPWRPLRNDIGIEDRWRGKNRLSRLQPGEKPSFVRIPPITFEE